MTETREGRKKEMRNVAALGGLGGLLVWLSSIWLGHSANLSIWADPLISVVLGGGAAVVFVFLIANTDRRDHTRLLALALLSGFFWEPVWQASRALVDRHIGQERAIKAKEAANTALSTARAFADADEAKKTELAIQLENDLRRASELSEQLDSLSALSAIRPVAEEIVSLTQGLPSDFVAQSAAAANFAWHTGGSVVQPETAQVQVEIARLRQTVDGLRLSNTELQNRLEDSNKAQILTLDSLLGLAMAPDGEDNLWGHALVGGPGSLRERVPNTLEQDSVPAPEDVQVLDFGTVANSTPEEDTEIAWFRLVITEPGSFVLDVESEAQDLYAALYSITTLQRLAFDDDSGKGNNPKIVTRLNAGEYLLRVSEFNGRALFPLSVRYRTHSAPSEGE